jgi:hypothetical protein
MKNGWIIFLLTLQLNSLSALGYYDCGLYGSVQAGWARMCTPNNNDFCDDYYVYEDRFDEIQGTRGCTAWGANIGYHYPYRPNLLISFEAGYHDNGYSEITFRSGNQYRIESTDVELLGVATYIWRPGVWFSVKGGAAKVRQIYRVWHMCQNYDIDPTSVVKKWAPTTSFAAGVTFCGLEFFAMYRYVFASDLTHMSHAFTIQKQTDSFPQTFLPQEKVARLHSLYAGIQASLY